uniref:heme oxygenase (biliverdin-producing) n=1 Tax=Echeneis naucrates TaxID=173247 RepID=A0A665WQ83_ECHNA
KMEPQVKSESKFTSEKNGGASIVVDDEALSPTDLSEMLAEGTKESHDRAENCQFVKDFLRGRIQRELFKRGTAALYFVYSALEEEIEKNKDHPHIAPIYFPTELHRHEALARDLEYFYGEDWESQISLSAGTKPYVDRIHEVGEKDPVLLVAHSYTRYMGDLSGGQILKKVAQRALKLPPTGEGLNFYYFEGIHSHKSFKQLYRSRMNELELQTDTKERIIDESNRAFGWTGNLQTDMVKIHEMMMHSLFLLCAVTLLYSFPFSFSCPSITSSTFLTAANGNPTYACHLAMMLLRHPPCQVALAAWVAALAVFTACYLL